MLLLLFLLLFESRKYFEFKDTFVFSLLLERVSFSFILFMSLLEISKTLSVFNNEFINDFFITFEWKIFISEPHTFLFIFFILFSFICFELLIIFLFLFTRVEVLHLLLDVLFTNFLNPPLSLFAVKKLVLSWIKFPKQFLPFFLLSLISSIFFILLLFFDIIFFNETPFLYVFRLLALVNEISLLIILILFDKSIILLILFLFNNNTDFFVILLLFKSISFSFLYFILSSFFNLSLSMLLFLNASFFCSLPLIIGCSLLLFLKKESLKFIFWWFLYK